MAYANMSTLGSHFLHLGKPTPTPHKKGTITLFCGPMFSGKTTHLILATRFKSRSDLKCLIVKYSQDKRHTAASDTVLTAFDNETQSPAISCGNHLGDLVPEMMKYDVISIDEGQFYDDIDTVAEDLAAKGKVVYISALDSDYRREGFGRIPVLIPKCEYIFKMVAVCGVCKGIASFTARTSNDEGLEVIGGADKYEPRCRMCHTYPTKKVELV